VIVGLLVVFAHDQRDSLEQMLLPLVPGGADRTEAELLLGGSLLRCPVLDRELGEALGPAPRAPRA